MIGRNVLSAAVCLLACSCCAFAQTKDDSTATSKPVEAALGRSGQMQPGEIYRFACRAKT